MFGEGLLVTFEISVVAQLVGIVIGLIAGLARLSQRRVVQSVAVAYIDFFRGVPLLVTLVWIYYGVALLFGINISAFVAGVSGLGITLGAYLAEVFRAGVQAIPRGQTEAAYSLGLNRRQTMWCVVLPQALRIVFPPLANSFIGMLKDSSLVAILSVTDLMRVGMIVAADTFRAFEAYTFVAVIYYVVTFITARAVTRIEKLYVIPR
ncbi:amino acid ABC transporter permease [Limobrevibacterium gyesilva]|uniref:Amino acid ABC transporter permease n=1 Tax=Limobrevibacterium gyesilva TaxID=2991712 RepID=A0AA41YJW9_9PROT|nr:amino acid ABC transporter permease [Limobrevibacterium gyesilva]MCW3474579.1 amino acid ABC transporter permease [Limobrevibacterium gyesilva]